jgi:TetR/AcrR family transcriptional regulator, transcriptional repressor of bet genes
MILSVLNGHVDFLVIRVYNNCMSARQVFTRESADIRKEALIAACAHCLAAFGAQGTSVRAICVEAGVSPGLLRHYFDGIDALVAATYRATGARVAKALHEAVAAVPADNPRSRLLAFVTASFREPIADPELLATWIAFWSLSRTDPVIGQIHGEIYADNRRDMEQLIAACPGAPDDPRLMAVALTALVDGLWLELSLGNAPFSVDEAEALAEKWLDSLLA